MVLQLTSKVGNAAQANENDTSSSAAGKATLTDANQLDADSSAQPLPASNSGLPTGRIDFGSPTGGDSQSSAAFTGLLRDPTTSWPTSDSPFGAQQVRSAPAAATNGPDASTKPTRPQPEKAKAFDEYAVHPEGKRTTPLELDSYNALDGTDVSNIATKPSEAKFLNDVRHQTRRFDAAALKAAQKTLGVSNASGAFNTETLRALLAKTGQTLNPKKSSQSLLTAEQVMTAEFWTPWYPDAAHSLFLPDANIPADVGADSSSTTYADKAAQAMGAKDYNDYHERVLQKIDLFLGKPVRGKKAHPDLIARLQAAENFLINYFKDKGKDGQPVPVKDIPAKIGWSGDLVTIYDDNPDTMVGGEVVTKADPEKGIKEVRKGGQYPLTHFHNMGLAVDFDPARNPYIFDQSDPYQGQYNHMAYKNLQERKDSQAKHAKDPSVPVVKESEQIDPRAAAVEARDYYDNMARAAYKQAADLYGGEPMSGEAMMQWSTNLSSEELHAKVAQASKSMASYLTDAEAAAQEKDASGPVSQKVLGLFAAAGYSPEKAKAGLEEMKAFPKAFWHIMSRDGSRSGTGTNKATNSQGLELTVALRDAGGLMWGGTEMSHGDNGDFMHFDLRQDAIGQRFLNFQQGKK